jgi:Flp pilus assembly protein protease CpaA
MKTMTKSNWITAAGLLLAILFFYLPGENCHCQNFFS